MQTNLADATGGAAGDTAFAGSDGNSAGSAGSNAAGTGASGGAGGSDNGFAGTTVNAGGDDGSGGSDSGSGGSAAGSGGSAGGECFDSTIESFCAERDCPSLEEAIEDGSSSICGVDGTTLDEGCGMVTVRRSVGLSSSSYTFVKSTGELIAASVVNDVPFGPCGTNSYRWGATIEPCDETRCYLCQPQAGQAGLECRLDCDCDSLEPIADPCFGPETCECYCSKLKATEG